MPWWTMDAPRDAGNTAMNEVYIETHTHTQTLTLVLRGVFKI